MRGSIEGLTNPNPMGPALPAIYQDQGDDFALRFLKALDEVIAPMFWTLDNIDAYLDPYLTPEDFVEWLATWVKMDIDETWAPEVKRALVAKAVELYRWRGTRRGITELVKTYTGVEPEVEENGGSAFSPFPGGELPGTPGPKMTIRVKVKDPATIDTTRLERVIAAAKPAHVAHTVEVLPA